MAMSSAAVQPARVPERLRPPSVPVGDAAAGGEQPCGAGDGLADLGGDGVGSGLCHGGQCAQGMAGGRECGGGTQVGENLRRAPAAATLGEPVALLSGTAETRGNKGDCEERDERVQPGCVQGIASEGCAARLREQKADGRAHHCRGSRGGAESPGEQTEDTAEQQGSKREVMGEEQCGLAPEHSEQRGGANEDGQRRALQAVARRRDGLCPWRFGRAEGAGVLALGRLRKGSLLAHCSIIRS